MKRLFVVLTVLIVALAFASTIKIGAVLPLSDITGRQAANAMKLAVKEINEAGGVLGMPVELFIIDDEMKPEKVPLQSTDSRQLKKLTSSSAVCPAVCTWHRYPY